MKVTCPHCGEEFEANLFGGAETPIRNARREKGITVNQAAEQMGISPYTLQSLERGRMNPRLSTIKAACKLYGKSFDELFPNTDDNLPEETDEAAD